LFDNHKQQLYIPPHRLRKQHVAAGREGEQMAKLNAAQQLRQAMGLEWVSVENKQREPSHTKSGPGRRHVDGSGKRSDKTLKQLSAGAFGRGLRNARDRKNRDAIEARAAKKMDQAGR
jgi:hypothetical protein